MADSKIVSMLLDYLAVGAALVGSSAAAYVDLRTTEIPDEIPAAMAVLGLALALYTGAATGSFAALASSILVGGLLLCFRFVM